jgi:hypothetical protein
MLLGRFFRVLGGVSVMPLGDVRVMRRLLMITGFVVLCGFPVVVGRVLMVIGGFRMVMRSFLRHE